MWSGFERRVIAGLAEQIVRAFPADQYPHFAEFTTEHVLRPGYRFAVSFEIGLELDSIPQLSEDQRRIGFGGVKVEDKRRIDDEGAERPDAPPKAEAGPSQEPPKGAAAGARAWRAHSRARSRRSRKSGTSRLFAASSVWV